jgi:hypothetical protein
MLRIGSTISTACAKRGCRNSQLHVCFCAGFSDAWMTDPSTRWTAGVPRNAKARNRGKLGAGGATVSMGICELHADLVLGNLQAPAAMPVSPQTHTHPCSCCGGRMIIIEVYGRSRSLRYRPSTRDWSRLRSTPGFG